MTAYTVLTAKSDYTYDRTTIVIDDLALNIKEYVRANTKNFSNSVVQRKCFELFYKEMGEDYGITFRDAKRTLSNPEKEAKLAMQGYKCFIDGKPLTLADAVWGHDTAWNKGGRLEEGAVIRRRHNIDMGSTTIDEYRMILAHREQQAA